MSARHWGSLAGVTAVAVVASLGVASCQRDTNEEHLRELAATMYSYSGYDDGEIPDGGGHTRDHYGTETCGDDDDWVGRYGIGVAGEDRVAGAERAATKLTEEGWSVERWVGRDTGGTPDRLVLAIRGSDTASLSYNVDSVFIGVGSGPCNTELGPLDPPSTGDYAKVEQFGD